MTDDTVKLPLRAMDLAKRTGLSERYFQQLFAKKKIAWASQPGGPRSPILFDEGGFEAWYDAGRNTKVQTWPKSSGAGSGRGRVRAAKGSRSVSPLEQRLREKLKSFSSGGSPA